MKCIRFLPKNVVKICTVSEKTNDGGARSSVGFKAQVPETRTTQLGILYTFHSYTTDKVLTLQFDIQLLTTWCKFTTLIMNAQVPGWVCGGAVRPVVPGLWWPAVEECRQVCRLFVAIYLQTFCDISWKVLFGEHLKLKDLCHFVCSEQVLIGR